MVQPIYPQCQQHPEQLADTCPYHTLPGAADDTTPAVLNHRAGELFCHAANMLKRLEVDQPSAGALTTVGLAIVDALEALAIVVEDCASDAVLAPYGLAP